MNVEEAILPRVHHDFLQCGMSNWATKTKYSTNLACLLPKQIYSSCIVDWGVLNNMGCAEEIEAMLEIKVYVMGGEEEIFMNDDELMTKKLIKFRLGGRGHTLTLLEFARCLGLYHSAQISDGGFEFITRIARRSGLLAAEDGSHGDSSRRELERMAHKQLYHTDRYAGVFEYMAGHYNVPLQGDYAPPSYFEEQQQHDEE
ncbi:hypothetical protein Tco_0818425 [Tanacetum coccineum]